MFRQALKHLADQAFAGSICMLRACYLAGPHLPGVYSLVSNISHVGVAAYTAGWQPQGICRQQHTDISDVQQASNPPCSGA